MSETIYVQTEDAIRLAVRKKVACVEVDVQLLDGRRGQERWVSDGDRFLVPIDKVDALVEALRDIAKPENAGARIEPDIVLDGNVARMIRDNALEDAERAIRSFDDYTLTPVIAAVAALRSSDTSGPAEEKKR